MDIRRYRAYTSKFKRPNETYKKIVLNELNHPFPQDPSEQLWGAISAVFSSWMNNRAITYRKLNNLPSSWGTVNIQSMVFEHG